MNNDITPNMTARYHVRATAEDNGIFSKHRARRNLIHTLEEAGLQRDYTSLRGLVNRQYSAGNITAMISVGRENIGHNCIIVLLKGEKSETYTKAKNAIDTWIDDSCKNAYILDSELAERISQERK